LANRDDVLQEVFVRVREAIGSYQSGRGRFRDWLRGVAHNTACEVQRKRGREWPALPEQHERPTDPDDPLDALIRAEIVGRALRVMQQDFEPTTWQAFQLFVCEGMTATEVGARLGISQVSVRVAKHRVLQRLRVEFGVLLD
jgi:RNA polymerase sigma-70 factor (ECF subfamily)